MSNDGIKCVLFCEFDNDVGPIIAHQVPTNFLPKEVFDSISVYVITKTDLRNHVMTFNGLGYKVVGCPVVIENYDKYKRNNYIFNVCLVFDARKNTTMYETVVKKLADYLTALETESSYLSDPESKQLMPDLMSQILNGLNSRGSCCINVNASTTIHLQLVSSEKDRFEVEAHHVPVRIETITAGDEDDFDIVSRDMLRHIDGVKHVLRLALECDVDLSIAKHCVKNLAQRGVVEILHIFQYGQMYAVTSKVSRLKSDRGLHDRCLKFVGRKGLPLPNMADVFAFYCSFCGGLRLKDLCNRTDTEKLNINEQRLVQFGQLCGILRPVHRFASQCKTQLAPVICCITGANSVNL